MFWTRFLSGAVLLLISFVCLHFGGWCLFAFCLLLSIGAYYEFTKALSIEKDKKHQSMTSIGYICVVLFYCSLFFFERNIFAIMAAVLCVSLILVVYVFTFPKYSAEDTTGAIFGFFYAPVMLSFLYLTRNLDNGKYIVWLIYISSWGYDTCAYLVGMATAKTIGNHKITPKLSPKKSIEGVVGGIAGAFLIGWLYGHFVMERFSDLPNVALMVAVISAAGAVLAQIGDLAASAFKRNKDIKDYSHLIPGHGGILDRFDSMIFTAPITYFLAVLIFSL